MDELLVGVAFRAMPFVFAAIGMVLIGWLLRTRLPSEITTEVLDALSETEALPASAICQRAPLAAFRIDPRTVAHVLDELCREGRVVRWYDYADDRESRMAVYRRVKRGSIASRQ
jgi:hypothetical protein